MVRQNIANKGVTAKVFFPNGLWVKCEALAVCRGFFLISILSRAV
jgi:hypothetical protein